MSARTTSTVLARVAPYGAFAGALLLVPAVVTRVPLYTMANGVQMAVLATAALGLVPLTGYARQISIGQAVFFGTGAYSSAIVTGSGLPVPLGATTGTVLAGTGAYLIARPLFRVEGHYLALATLALGLIVSVAARRLDVTGGSEGLTGIPPLAPAVVGDVAFYYVAAAVLFLVVVAVRELLGARLGRALAATGDAPVVAAVAGIRVADRKRHAFVLAALLASIAGSLYAHWIRYVDPGVLELQLSLQILIVATVGGLRTAWGPPAGALIVVSLLQLSQEALPQVSDRVGGQTDVIVYGVALVLVLLFLPDGVAGGLISRVPAGWRPGHTAAGGGSGPNAAAAGAPAPAVAVPAGPGPVAIDIRDLWVVFGGVHAIDGLTVHHAEGGVVGLIGPNGAGKTTVLDVLCGLVRPTTGTIRLDGQPIGGLRPDRIARRGVARTFQAPRAFVSLSAVDSVRVAIEAHRSAGQPSADARAALAETGLADHVDRPLATLPYGAQRRVDVARALAVRPRLLLLDEPFAGSTPTEADELCAIVRALPAHGVTVLLVEHNMAAVMRLCDRVIVLDHGRLLADGTPAEIRAHEQVRAAYLGYPQPESVTGTE